MKRGAALLAASCWAAGTWCAAGAIAAAGEGAANRIGVLPPWWLLAALLAAAWLAVVIARMSADATRPLFAPLVSTIAWLPIPTPAAALIWVGPLGLMLSGTAAIATGVLAARERGVKARPPREGGAAAVPPWWRRFGGVVALAAVFALAAWRMAPVLPGGDEPHYLIITQSLLNDGDLRIEDNHRRREYAAYLDGELRPDYLRRGRDREIYSIHAPGVSALVLPVFAVAGYAGAVLLLCALSALGTAAVWKAARVVGGSTQAAWFATAGVALSAPFFFMTFTIYPDGPAAVVVVAVVWLALVRGRVLDARTAAACGVLLACLPWLHTRYAAIAGPLGMVVLARIARPVVGAGAQGPKAREQKPGAGALPVVAFLVPALIGAAAWVAYFGLIYGEWDPRAAYGYATDMRLARIPHGLAGLLIDQQFGLLPNAPVYLIAFAGFPALWRQSRRLACELLVTIVPYALAVAAFHMWWGGRSSPARFLVPVLLPLALPMAAWWSRRERRSSRTIGMVLLGVSIAIAFALACVDRGVLAYNSRDGHALWLLAANRAANLTFALPSLFQTGPLEATRLALAWSALAALAWAALRHADRRLPRAGAWALAAGAALVLYVTAGASAGWALTGHDGADGGSGAAWVAARAACREGNAAGLGDLPPILIEDASRRPLRERGPVWTATDLPPGRYRLALTSASGASGTVRFALGRPDSTIATCTLREQGMGPTDCEIALPAGAGILFVDADDELRRRGARVALALETFAPAQDCHLRAVRAARNGGGVLYVLDGRAFVEPGGLWTAGQSSVTIVPSAARNSGNMVRLLLRHGAAGGRITVRSGRWEDAREVAAGETWAVEVPTPPRDSAHAIEISTTAAFRPSEVDPTSADHRLLGAWISMP